jgi:hypothetical protein
MVRAAGLIVLVAACTSSTPKYAGRPCSEQEPCGGGLRCDSATHVCVEGGAAGDEARELSGADLPSAPDHRSDLFLVPDGGCPSGRQPCGSICVDLKTDFQHCSACDKPCPVGTTDTCQAGTCTCGQGAACTGGLNCVGGSCRCIAGATSQCAGCCTSATSCVAVAGQSLASCGSAGETCKSCDDKNECTTDSCSAGACSSKAVTDGTLCSGGTKVCTSGGCGGCVKQCSGKSCGADSCGGQCGTCSPPKDTCSSGQCVCVPKCAGKNCGPDGCGAECGTCGSSDYCDSGTCTGCPSCVELGYYTGSLRGCTFDGSNGCWCPGSDGNGNNVCDSGEDCWGWDNCSTGNHNPANCHTKHGITAPLGCPPINYCIECS